MVTWETKLKLGRKLEGVDADTASANQISVLFRVTPDGKDEHVSLSVESDSMSAADVAAVLRLLDERGVLRGFDSKTWVSQPQASVQRFGETTEWAGADIEELASRLARGFSTTSAGAAPASAPVLTGRARRSLAEVERAVAELRAALLAKGAPDEVESGGAGAGSIEVEGADGGATQGLRGTQ